jgi:hypothetical protein
MVPWIEGIETQESLEDCAACWFPFLSIAELCRHEGKVVQLELSPTQDTWMYTARILYTHCAWTVDVELQNLRTWLRREENHFVVTVGEDNDVRVHNIKEGPRRHPFKKQNRTKPHEIETQRWYFTRCFRCVNLLLPWFPCVSHVVREFSISFLSFRSLPRSRSLTLRVALRGLVGPHIPHRTDTDKIRKVSQWFSEFLLPCNPLSTSSILCRSHIGALSTLVLV